MEGIYLHSRNQFAAEGPTNNKSALAQNQWPAITWNIDDSSSLFQLTTASVASDENFIIKVTAFSFQCFTDTFSPHQDSMCY